MIYDDSYEKMDNIVAHCIYDDRYYYFNFVFCYLMEIKYV